MNRPTALTLPRAILFDMDGTLTEPLLDFDQIRRDMGICSGPILEALVAMPAVDRAAAEKILHEHEQTAAEKSTLNPGCRELLEWVETAGLLTALVTRNSRQSVETVFSRHRLNIAVCVTREDGKYKPHPDPLQLACRRLNVAVEDAWMVGDGYHDIEAGVAAGMRTVWISHGRERDFEAEPDILVNNLPGLMALLRNLINRDAGLGPVL